ncbi:hypothetical protein KC614_00680 [candidate division WWE3 bacterium]|uniref:Uncharacterized protein n=1 Tax=candidate division WWE3 bacterium TaxID=2053526 RepID=A0A955RQQ7_UNCKA|nr:hypothetical protein [candidate division WWE3 bacterium]
MTIKLTQKKGLSINTQTGEVILGDDVITVVPDEKVKTQTPKFEIVNPGEYEVADIAVTAYNPMPAAIIEAEQITVVYMPSPPETLEESSASEFERVDVLIIPGKRSDLVGQLAPYIVIPLNDEEYLAEKLGAGLSESQKSLTLKSRTDLPEETEIVFFS